MRVDPEIQDVAAAIVGHLVRGGAIRATGFQQLALERESAWALVQAMRRERDLAALESPTRLETLAFGATTARFAQMLRSQGAGRGLESVVEALVACFRESENLADICADDGELVRKILSLIGQPLRRPRRSVSGGGAPPAGSAPAGGLPAEVRAWEVRPGDAPEEPDPERRERPLVRRKKIRTSRPSDG
jgi:hypothetical protein